MKKFMIITIFGKSKTKLKNGKWKEFNKRAVLIAEGHYLHDRKHGTWREYYDEGNLMLEETYENGVMHGKFSSYRPNGQKLSEGKYINGSREGYFKLFDESDRHTKSLLFVNNQLIKEIREVQNESD